MPQGEGTYGSQVGRPSKKRTSYVNDNSWWDKLTSGFRNLRPYNPQSSIQNMQYREGKSMLTSKPTNKPISGRDTQSESKKKDVQHKKSTRVY